MKFICAIFVAMFFFGCTQNVSHKNNQNIIQEGEVYYICYRVSPLETTALASEDYDGAGKGVNSMTQWRTPYVTVYADYILITYPGTDAHDITIPREALFNIIWKKRKDAELNFAKETIK